MSDPNIKELLEEQLRLAKDFPRANFGLLHGHDYPEIARSALSSADVCRDLLMNYVMSSIRSGEVAESINPGAFQDSREIVQRNTILHDQALKYLYLGIQIGRALEKQVAEALLSLAEEESKNR
jgi:hypothetical protein